jgi:hypothetical protein
MYEHARIQKQISLACMVLDMHGLGRLVCRTSELDDNYAFFTRTFIHLSYTVHRNHLLLQLPH